MQAFRRALTASTDVLTHQQQQRAFSSASKKPRMTWRQKQKLEEKRKNPNAHPPRQPPREKVERKNYLITPPVDDGKKWRILSASILERLPVIQPDLKSWEEDFEMMEHEIALREDQRLEDDFWFMEPGTRHITPEEAPLPNEPDDPEEIVGAGFHLAPRETEDDLNDNRKSLNRALKGRVFLIVKNAQTDAKFPWFFPVGEKKDDEKMRDAAVRHLSEFCGEELEVTPVGFAPIGYVSYLHDKEKDGSEYDGTKVFFYKSQHLIGDVQLQNDKSDDYLWVTQNELAEYLDTDIADYVKKIVPP